MKPSLLFAIRLRCPYCGKTPLRQLGSWFQFRLACPQCRYQFEREEGYFGGATHLGLSFMSLVSCGGAALVLWRFPETDALAISLILAVVILGFGVWSFPYNRAIWIYIDHRLHPLSADERSEEQ